MWISLCFLVLIFNKHMVNCIHDDDLPMLPKGNYTIAVILNYSNWNGTGCKADMVLASKKYIIYATMLGILNEELRSKSIDPLYNFQLGLQMIDYCTLPHIALYKAMQLIWNEISSPLELDESQNESSGSTLLGVITPEYDFEANILMQQIFKSYRIPHIGYLNLDPIDNQTYMTIGRGGAYQMDVIIAILVEFQWKHIAVIRSKGYQSESHQQGFRSLAEKNGICIFREVAVGSDTNYSHVVTKINADEFSTNVIVGFWDSVTMNQVFEKIQTLHLSDRFIVINGLTWDGMSYAEPDLFQHNFSTLGCIIIKDENTSEKSLFPFEEEINRFLDEKFIPVISSMKDSDIDSNFLHRKVSYHFRKIWYVSPSFKAMLDSLIEYRKTVTEDSDFHKPQRKDREKYLTIIRNKIIETNKMNYNPSHSGRYAVINYQLLSDYTLSPVQLGMWTDGVLNLTGPYRFRNYLEKPVIKCGTICKRGYYKDDSRAEHGTCCPPCARCKENQISNFDQSSCITCSPETWPNSDQSYCAEFTPKFIQWDDSLAIVAQVLSAVGILSTLIVTCYYIKFYDTPIVRASLRELKSITLAGIFLSHFTVFLSITRPYDIICAFLSGVPGISFVMIYGSLWMKTTRISVLMKMAQTRSTETNLLWTLKTLVSLTWCFIGIEILLIIITLIRRFPCAEITPLPHIRRSIFTCPHSGSMFVPLIFGLLLFILCTVNAIRIRNVIDNFKEAECIGFAMYSTSILWVAFIGMYFLEFEWLLLAIATSITSTVILWFTFGPILYIIIKKPEKNADDLLVINNFVAKLHKMKANKSKQNIKDSATQTN